jgi:hypothetical protein
MRRGVSARSGREEVMRVIICGAALGVVLLGTCAARAQDKIGPDTRFSPDGRPVRVVPIAPGGAPAPVPSAPPPDEPAPAQPAPAPIAKAPPAPAMSPERCSAAGMDYDAAKAVCRERPASAEPAALPEAPPAPAEPPAAWPAPSYSPPTWQPPRPTPAAPAGWPPPGYPAACPWPLPAGMVCTPDGARRARR